MQIQIGATKQHLLPRMSSPKAKLSAVGRSIEAIDPACVISDLFGGFSFCGSLAQPMWRYQFNRITLPDDLKVWIGRLHVRSSLCSVLTLHVSQPTLDACENGNDMAACFLFARELINGRGRRWPVNPEAADALLSHCCSGGESRCCLISGAVMRVRRVLSKPTVRNPSQVNAS